MYRYPPTEDSYDPSLLETYDPSLPGNFPPTTTFNPGFNSYAPGYPSAPVPPQSNNVFIQQPHYGRPDVSGSMPPPLRYQMSWTPLMAPPPSSTTSSDPPSDVSSARYDASTKLPQHHRGAGAVVEKVRQSRKLPLNHSSRRIAAAGSSTLGDDSNIISRDDNIAVHGRRGPPTLPFGFSGVGGFSQPLSISARHPTLWKVLDPIEGDIDIVEDKRVLPTAVHLYMGFLATSSEIFVVYSTKDWQSQNKDRAAVAVQLSLLRYNLPREFMHGEASRMCALTMFCLTEVNEVPKALTDRVSRYFVILSRRFLQMIYF